MTRDHSTILGSRQQRWPDEEACRASAVALASRGELRDALIELRGPLGAGKTTFVRHLLRALGVRGRIKSPSFAVVEPYELPGFDVSHIDFYRFDDPHEWEEAGLRELIGRPGLKLIEWPERAEGLLPTPDLRIELSPLDEHRRDVRIQACTPRGADLLK